VATQRRLTDQGRERKQQLLDAAADLFAARGYGATRIVDICQQAGVAKGLFYWYFDSKEALLTELVRSMRQKLRRTQAAAMEGIDGPIDRLRRGTEASVLFMAEHRSYFALLEMERTDARMAPVLREGGEVYSRDVARLIREAQQLGSIPDDVDAELASLGVLATVSSFGQYVRSGRLEMPVADLARFVGDWVVRALGALTEAPAPS
jgi:AcrR family transcriptional regulator